MLEAQMQEKKTAGQGLSGRRKVNVKKHPGIKEKRSVGACPIPREKGGAWEVGRTLFFS